MLLFTLLGISAAIFLIVQVLPGDAVDAMLEGWVEESGGPFLLGKAITYADICIMPVIVRMQDLGRSDLWASNTKVIEWLKLIQSSAIYEKTYCEGSLLSQVYPHLRNG